MVYCPRCWLHHGMRVVNIVVNFLGICMIVYSLWLLKLWRERLVEVGVSPSSLPRPWFIHTLLGIGIIVCFTALLGHMISNCIDTTALSIYILFLCFILLFQIVLTTAVFFKRDWTSVISKYLDGKDDSFENIVTFHLTVCRVISITIILAQVNVLVLATVLWALGPQQRNHCESPATRNFIYSFLASGSDSPSAVQIQPPPLQGESSSPRAVLPADSGQQKVPFFGKGQRC